MAITREEVLHVVAALGVVGQLLLLVRPDAQALRVDAQVDVPAQLVVLAVVGVVAGDDGELQRPAGRRAHQLAA